MNGFSIFWICSACTFFFVMGSENGPSTNTGPIPSTNAQNPLTYDYARMLEELGAKRILQLQQQLVQLQLAQQQQQKLVHNQPAAQIPSPYAPYLNQNFVPNLEPITKRSPHQIQQRAVMNQFKNCYFSPVQCVLLTKRGGFSSFA